MLFIKSVKFFMKLLYAKELFGISVKLGDTLLIDFRLKYIIIENSAKIPVIQATTIIDIRKRLYLSSKSLTHAVDVVVVVVDINLFKIKNV